MGFYFCVSNIWPPLRQAHSVFRNRNRQGSKEKKAWLEKMHQQWWYYISSRNFLVVLKSQKTLRKITINQPPLEVKTYKRNQFYQAVVSPKTYAFSRKSSYTPLFTKSSTAGITPRPNWIKIFCESQSNQWPGDLHRVTMEGFEGFQKYFQGSLGR